jgi:hypothetical protein
MHDGNDLDGGAPEIWGESQAPVAPPDAPAPPDGPDLRGDRGDAQAAGSLYAGMFDERPGAIPSDLLGRLEAATGTSLGDVRLHTGAGAAQHAAREDAQAFAVGRDVFFGASHFDPSSDDGRWLIAHEVAHTVQQAGSAPSFQAKLESTTVGDADEQAADGFADAFVAGQVTDELRPRAGSSGPRIARHPNRRQERNLGTDSPTENEDGTPVERVDNGVERGQGRVHRTDENGNRHTRIRHRTGGILTQSNQRGTRTEALDGRAMAGELHRELETLDRELETEARTADAARRAEIVTERQRLAADLAACASPAHDFDPDRVDEIARRHRIPIRPAYRTTEADVVTERATNDVNPLDGTLGRETETEREIVEEGGLQATERNRAANRVNLGDGRLERETEREITVSRNGDGEMRSSDTQTLSGGLGGNGSLTGRREVVNEVETENPDGTTVREARGRTVEAGVVLNENEEGIRLGGGRSREREDENGEDGQETNGGLTITNRRLAGNLEHERTQRRGNLEATVKTAADGSFSIDIEPADDGQYRLTFTIHMGVAVGGSLARRRRENGQTRGTNASLSGNAGAQGDLTTTRMLTEEEARRYLDAADRADRGESPTQPGEFGRWARLRAAAENGDALTNGVAVFNSSDAARDMREGESVTLDTMAAVGVNGTLGHQGQAFGVGVEGGAQAEWQRIVQVERIAEHGHPRVRITVTYRRASEWHAGGNVSIEGVRGGVNHREESGDMERIQVVLDPGARDYAAQYDRVVGTLDRDELRRVAAREDLQDDIRERTLGQNDGSETGYEAGGPLSLTGQEGDSGSEEVGIHTDENGVRHLEGTVQGENHRRVGLNAGGQEVLHVGEEERLNAELDEDSGMNIDLEEAEQSSDPLRTARRGYDAMAEGSNRERLNHALAESPSERLNQLLTTEYEHLHGYHLDEHDLETLASRGGQAEPWARCCEIHERSAIEAWARLGRTLARPRLVPAEAEVSRVDATKLARARALREWMRVGEGAHESIGHALNNWRSDGLRDSREERVGRQYEWPSELGEERAAYQGILGDLRSLRAENLALLDEEDGKGQERAKFLRLGRVLDTTLGAVRRSDDFESEAARSRVIGEIETWRGELQLAHREFGTAWEARHPTDGSAPAQAPERGSEEAREELRDHMQARGRAAIRAAIRTLRQNHARERQLLVRAGLLLDDPWPWERDEAFDICCDVHEMHRTWITQITELRVAYEQAGVPPEEWEISSGPGDRRNYDLEPNIGWVIGLYQRARDGHAVALNHGVDPAEEWRAQARY